MAADFKLFGLVHRKTGELRNGFFFNCLVEHYIKSSVLTLAIKLSVNAAYCIIYITLHGLFFFVTWVVIGLHTKYGRMTHRPFPIMLPSMHRLSKRRWWWWIHRHNSWCSGGCLCGTYLHTAVDTGCSTNPPQEKEEGSRYYIYIYGYIIHIQSYLEGMTVLITFTSQPGYLHTFSVCTVKTAPNAAYGALGQTLQHALLIMGCYYNTTLCHYWDMSVK